MGLLTKLIIFVLVISFMVFVTFFGRIPALRNTPIGALHRTIWVHIPGFLSKLDDRFTGGYVFRGASSFFHAAMYERHWTVVIFFIAVMLGGEYLYLPAVWPLLSSHFVKFTVVVTVAMPYGFLWLACAADPGFIGKDNMDYHMSLFPYDYANFHPGNMCRTCNMLKPARSKHCSLCKRCVAKSDHHCVFINSCVGYGNQHWFLLLLFTTGLLTSYGSLLGMYFLSKGMKQQYPDLSLWPSWERGFIVFLGSWSIALEGSVTLGSTTLLAILTSPMVWGLLGYTLYHVYRGFTTNESLKWSDWQEDIKDGLAFQRALPGSRIKDRRIEPVCQRWPLEPQSVVMATIDGKVPTTSGAPLPGEGAWKRIQSIREVENLYDMGFWDNLADVFVKDYSFGVTKDDLPVDRIRQRR